MGISEHAKTFADLPVRLYDPESKTKVRSPCVYRVGGLEHIKSEDNEGKYEFPELLDLFLTQHGGKELTALVIGAWNYNDMVAGLGDRGAADVVEALVANRSRMPNLRALFFGDITFEECEISWIGYGDISALLPAFPKLEEFRIRGAATLSFGKLKHSKLQSLAVESGGLPQGLLQEIWEAGLPKLEHLELWLGTGEYGGITDPAPLEPLLTGKLFKKLKYLGLRNCEIADAVAKAVAESPLLGRLEVLDLSLGNIGEAGAEALLVSPAVRKLKKLDLHHHYISPVFVKHLRGLPIEVDVAEALAPKSTPTERRPTLTVTSSLPSDGGVPLRVVVIGHPGHKRVTLFQEALARWGLPPAHVVAWRDLLTGRDDLRRAVRGGALVRVESPGQDFEVEKLLLAAGAVVEETEDAGAALLAAEEALRLPFDRGRLLCPRQWYRGFPSVLRRSPGIWQGTPASVG